MSDSDAIAIKIGRELKAYFIRQGISQEQIANSLGVTQQYISAMLNGRPFGRNTARKWSKVFGFSTSWLLTGEGEMFTETYMNENGNKTEEPRSTYGEKEITGKLLTLLTEKDKQIEQLLRVVEEQATTIKLLQNNPY